MNLPIIDYTNQLQWPEWHNKPLRLTAEEIDNPTTVIEHFYYHFTLPYTRDFIKRWLNNNLAKDAANNHLDVCLHDHLERFIEAVWVMKDNGYSNKHKNKPAPEAGTEILNKKPRLIEMAVTAPFSTIQEIYQKRGYEQLKESIRLWYGIAFLPDITVYIEPEHRLGLYTLFGKLEFFYEALYIKQGGDINKTELLSKQQIANPLPVITEFFKEFPIVYLRREFADWLDAGLTFDGPFTDELPPISIYYTHESLLCLVEAAYNYLKELDSEQKQ